VILLWVVVTSISSVSRPFVMKGGAGGNIECVALKSAAAQLAHCYGLPDINKLN
jgi:hypothetical protein